jgi:urease accessory protein UreE
MNENNRIFWDRITERKNLEIMFFTRQKVRIRYILRKGNYLFFQLAVSTREQSGDKILYLEIGSRIKLY